MIDSIVEKYIKKDKKKKSPMDKVRIPVAPPSKSFKDKNKYTRKEKHKKDEE